MRSSLSQPHKALRATAITTLVLIQLSLSNVEPVLGLSSNDILLKAKTLDPWITQTRRDLHRIPESGSIEFQTSAQIRSVLQSHGIPHR